MRKVELLPTRDCEAGYGPDYLGPKDNKRRFVCRAYTVRPLFKKFTQHCVTFEPTNCCVKKNTQLV